MPLNHPFNQLIDLSFKVDKKKQQLPHLIEFTSDKNKEYVHSIRK